MSEQQSSGDSAERNKSRVMCIGWPTIRRLMQGESVWFEELGCGAVAASDLLQATADSVDEHLWGRFVNHYWDSLEGDKALVLQHIRAVMDYHAANRLGTEPQTAPKLEALESCKGEQLKFEEWAAAEKYDMHEHPLHYLFMDDKTNAARQGWKAALRYAATVIACAQCQAESVK